MTKHCFSIPQDATVRLSDRTEGVATGAFDALSKAVSTVQGMMSVASGDQMECTVEIPDDEAAQSAFKLMASEVLHKFEYTCPD